MIPVSTAHPLQNAQPPPLAMAVFPADEFNATNSSWNSNQEIARLLYSAPNHPEWLTQKVALRPKTGAQYMFCRFDGNWFKIDGYEWKKRREGKLIREDHMKLKVNKQEILSANYAHSSVVPTFHRRVYWLTNNPEYVLVHYLNTETEINLKSAIDKISACIKLNSLNLNKQQLLDQVSPIYANMLCQQDIATLCEEICNMLQNAQQNELDTTATGPSSVMEPNSISYITHSALHRLERRNSCSSEFRHGLSSSALRRQPSTYSDCLDVIHGGASVINNTVEGKLSRETCTGYSADGRSHSCETYGSSNQDEESSSVQPSQPVSQSSFPSDNQLSTYIAPITEMTPNSGCVKGGTKALIVGGWYMKGHSYSVMFGEKSVLARLVQVGVLSLIVPPRSVCGVVPVRVLCNGHVISTSVDFTYINDRDEVTMSSLRQCMVDRLHFIAHAFGASDKLEWVTPVDENSILSLLRSLTTFHLSMPSILSTHPSLPSRTILHIAAALNYDKVIECVLAWRVLVRACRTTVDVLDDRGRTPCDLSRDEQMIRLTARSVDHDFEEQRTLPKSAEDVEHVTSTALWVLTNGETVTDEHLLRDQPPTVAEDSSSTILSESPNRSHNHSTPGTNKEKWCNEPLHVEISMDTDVYVPDSPKMADLFEAVTRQVFNVVCYDGVRAKMALLAQQIIDAIPDRIKNDANPLLDDETTNAEVGTHSSFAYPDNNPFLSHLTHDCPEEWDFQQYFSNNHYQISTDKSPDDVLSSFSEQPSSSSFYHRHLYSNKGESTSFTSSREDTLESTSFDFDKDLDEFFNIRVDREEDPIRQRLGGLKLSG
ncbi:hypothetical protein Angca_006503, partial [Angiostrongylus cantonensis]